MNDLSPLTSTNIEPAMVEEYSSRNASAIVNRRFVKAVAIGR